SHDGRLADNGKSFVAQARERLRLVCFRLLALPRHRRSRQVQCKSQRVPPECIVLCCRGFHRCVRCSPYPQPTRCLNDPPPVGRGFWRGGGVTNHLMLRVCKEEASSLLYQPAKVAEADMR